LTGAPMKIKTKFIISLMLLIVLPAISTILITSNVLSDNLDFIDFFDSYYDIFNNFSKLSSEFETFIDPYVNSPEYFLTDDFMTVAADRFSSAFISIEVYENNQLARTTYTDKIVFNNVFEEWIYNRETNILPNEQYSLKHLHFERLNNGPIDSKLTVDSGRLEIAYRVFERVFLLLYAIFNIILLSVILSWISNPIKRSIRRLTYTTNEIRKGNLNAKLEYNENDDFEGLAESIESMRQSLKRSVQKQQVLELEKKELIANFSHDLRTPITSIRGYVQGLRDGVARTEVMQREYLDTIAVKTDMLESLVNDLSEMAKYDQQGIQLKLQLINLRNFLFDCVDELQRDVKKAGGNLYLHYIIKDTYIYADPEKLMRVFINVIENAIKYRSSDPIEIVILANRDDDGVLINISDNGIGVPDDAIEKIFERFYRSDKSRNLNIKGSGIGLSICREIIELHGGRITAYSNKSKGLTLSIRLKAYKTDKVLPY
jgi:histidine kinase